jgi:uncharacterized membrane protein
MACNPKLLRDIPLFALLDDEEMEVLAAQVELVTFAERQRIYKMGDPGGQAFVMVKGKVRVTTVDADHQEVIVAEPSVGELFGFASMLDRTAHQTSAIAVAESVCIKVESKHIAHLLERKPQAGMDMLAALGREIHSTQQLVRVRSFRNPNEVIEGEMTHGERIADVVARFGGSWSFIIAFAVVLIVYSGINIDLGKSAWDPYPFILLNLFLSMLAAIQAPVIMMSQNRQDSRDRVRGELDYEVNRRAEAEIQALSRKLNLLGEKIIDVEDLVRDRLTPL